MSRTKQSARKRPGGKAPKKYLEQKRGKKAASAYALFVSSIAQQVKQENPQAEKKELEKIYQKQWNAVDANGKQVILSS